MKHRLYNPRRRQIEVASSKGSYFKINEEIFTWSSEYKYYCGFKQLPGSPSHSTFKFDSQDPYVLKINQIWYFTVFEFRRIIRQINEIAKEGKFKEVWFIYDSGGSIVCDNKLLEFDKTVILLENLQLLNFRKEGNIIKWDVEDET